MVKLIIMANLITWLSDHMAIPSDGSNYHFFSKFIIHCSSLGQSKPAQYPPNTPDYQTTST